MFVSLSGVTAAASGYLVLVCSKWSTLNAPVQPWLAIASATVTGSLMIKAVHCVLILSLDFV